VADVFQQEDDYVAPDGLTALRFRAWTGPTTRFHANRDPDLPDPAPAPGEDLDCNDQVALFINVPQLPQLNLNPNNQTYLTMTGAAPGTSVTGCQVKLALPLVVADALRTVAVDWAKGHSDALRVEYKIKTWHSSDFLHTARDSNLPGGGFWSTGADLPSAVFFITPDGRPHL
jgi:hypothetical protein